MPANEGALGKSEIDTNLAISFDVDKAGDGGTDESKPSVSRLIMDIRLGSGLPF